MSLRPAWSTTMFPVASYQSMRSPYMTTSFCAFVPCDCQLPTASNCQESLTGNAPPPRAKNVSWSRPS